MSDEVHSHAVEGTETREEIEQVAEISASRSQACTSHNEVLLDIRDEVLLLTKLGQLEEELNATKRQSVWPNGENGAKIKRIPEIMKRNVNFEKYFTPKEWKLGPIHCYHFSNYEIKLKLAAHFISKSGSKREDIFKNFEIKMKDIRTYFDEDMTSKIGDDELMRLLFLDGCAILGFIHCYMNLESEVVGISDALAEYIEWDLLLLENQIPFKVLEVLIGSGTDKQQDYLKKCFLKFILLICWNTFRRHSTEDLYKYLDKYCFSPEINMNRRAVHLLDISREALLFNPSSSPLENVLTIIWLIFLFSCSCGSVAIAYVRKHLEPEPYLLEPSRFRTAKEFFFSVQELKTAGIKFKPSHTLKTISFHSRFYFRPQLMLPTLIVNDSTASKLVNLVAYEMCLPKSHPNETPWVTSYVNLLDSLVDNEQDIKDLRASDILWNTLSTDILAAELINNVGAGCVAPTRDAYVDVKEK